MKKLTRIIAALTAAVTVLAASGCKRYAPNEVVYVYNWGEYMDESINRQFEQETGIHVVYKTYDNNESMYAVLKNNPGIYDVVIPSDYMIARLINEDMLEPIDFSNVPNFQYIMDDFKNLEYDPENRYSVPYTWGILGMLYNTKIVTEEPTSWSALWDTRYAGKILMYDNSRDTLGVALLKNGCSLNTTSEAELKQANADLLEQKKLLLGYVSDEIFDYMESGTGAICPVYCGDAITMMEENADLAYTVPKEGANRFVDCACVVKGAKNKTAAEQYINFLCRQDIAERNRAFTCYSTPQSQVWNALPDEEKNNEIAYPGEEVLKNTEVYLNLPQATLELYNDLWNELKN